MKNTFDVPELPEIHPVDVPVLFEDRFGQAAPASSDGRRQERGKSVGDHADGVSKELDACMAVLEKIKPEVRHEVCAHVILHYPVLHVPW